MRSIAYKQTRSALFWMNLAGEPLVALIPLLQLILHKGLGASLFEISLFTAIRPVISVFSFYWGANLAKRPHKLKTNLMLAWFLSRLPFVFLPLFPTVWYVIFATACYQLFVRAGTPALMEILKMNVDKKPREKMFTTSYVLCFLESIALSIFLGQWLDSHQETWMWLFSGSSLLSLAALIFQMQVPVPEAPEVAIKEERTLRERIIGPWLESYKLLKENPQFAHFQGSFMFGGFGLMLMAPALSIYMADVLKITYSDFFLARCLWMAVGVTISSTVWRMLLSKMAPHRMTSFICALFALYPLALLVARIEFGWFYLAFLLYGIAQAGSHLIWNLSGTLFAGDDNSAKYTTVNILTVGLRGLVAPALGWFICATFGPSMNLFLGMSLCLFGGWYMFSREKNLAQA